jgi:hypothetical protein
VLVDDSASLVRPAVRASRLASVKALRRPVTSLIGCVIGSVTAGCTTLPSASVTAGDFPIAGQPARDVGLARLEALGFRRRHAAANAVELVGQGRHVDARAAVVHGLPRLAQDVARAFAGRFERLADVGAAALAGQGGLQRLRGALEVVLRVLRVTPASVSLRSRSSSSSARRSAGLPSGAFLFMALSIAAVFSARRWTNCPAFGPD